MGIKNLVKLLKEYPDLIETTNIKKYKGQKIAIDISIMLYQVIISVRNSGADLTNKQGEITSHILGLFNKTIKLLNNGILPVYIFDGKPPELKRNVLNNRKIIKEKAREKMSTAKTEEEKIKYFKRTVCLTKQNLNDCKELLDHMGIPYINAPEEADSQCAWLCKNGYVDAVLTEDMDILTFGAKKIVRNLTSQNKKITEISLEKIKNKFNWNQDQFIQFCILLGCDYCQGIKFTNVYNLLKKFQKYKDIDNFLISENQKIEYKMTKSYFCNPNVIKNKTIFEMKKPNINKLNEILVNKHGLIKYKIKNKLNYLMINYAKVSCQKFNPIKDNKLKLGTN